MAATWDQADHFLVPLLNGRFGVGQVVELSGATGSPALCALTLRMLEPGGSSPPLALDEIVAVHLIQPPEDQSQRWPVIGFEQIPAVKKIFPLELHVSNGFADLTPQEPAIIEAFLSACHGLYPWDGFPDRAFFSALLLDPDNPPPARKTKSQIAPE